MQQSKIGSLIETILNTLVGFVGSMFIIWPLAAWVTGMEYTGKQQFWVVIIFTVWSVGRGYAMRRWANKAIHNSSIFLARLFS